MKQSMKVSAIFDYILTLFGFLTSALIIFLMLSVCTEVVMRYFLNRPQVWTVEIAEYTLLWITFLGAAWVLKKEGHVKMDIVLGQLKPGTQAVVNIITSVIGVIICLVLTWYSAEITWDHYQRGIYEPATLLDLPKAPIMVIIPVGSFLLLIQFLRRSYDYLGSWRASRDNE